MNRIKPEIGDEAVRKATGRDWASWMKVLDAARASTLPHAQIALLLRADFACTPWWSQMIAVHYERRRGLRQKHEKADGFEVNVSRTVDLPIGVVFGAWDVAGERRRWAPMLKFAAPRSRANHSIRAEGEAGAKILVRFTPKGATRTLVVVEHSKLASRTAVERQRRFWRDVLDRMGELQPPTSCKGGSK